MSLTQQSLSSRSLISLRKYCGTLVTDTSISPLPSFVLLLYILLPVRYKLCKTFVTVCLFFPFHMITYEKFSVHIIKYKKISILASTYAPRPRGQGMDGILGVSTTSTCSSHTLACICGRYWEEEFPDPSLGQQTSALCWCQILGPKDFPLSFHPGEDICISSHPQEAFWWQEGEDQTFPPAAGEFCSYLPQGPWR